jgi:hypothetical protein
LGSLLDGEPYLYLSGWFGTNNIDYWAIVSVTEGKKFYNIGTCYTAAPGAYCPFSVTCTSTNGLGWKINFLTHQGIIVIKPISLPLMEQQSKLEGS